MGLGVMSLIIVMSVIIGIIAFLMGSGNAPFYSLASIAPAIAEKFGVHAADVLLPLQTMTGFGRTDVSGDGRHCGCGWYGRCIAIPRCKAQHGSAALLLCGELLWLSTSSSFRKIAVTSLALKALLDHFKSSAFSS